MASFCACSIWMRFSASPHRSTTPPLRGPNEGSFHVTVTLTIASPAGPLSGDTVIHDASEEAVHSRDEKKDTCWLP